MQKINYKNQFFKVFVLGLISFVAVIAANAASVSLTATPTLQTVNVGQTTTFTIKINRDNFADKVTLSVTGLPSGATASFAPNTTTAASSILTVNTLTTTPVGTFILTVKGTATGIAIAPITVKLTTKPLPSVAVAVNPATQSIIAGQSTFYDITITRLNYDGAVTLSAENLPSGVSVLFEPATTYGNSSRMYLYSNGLPFFSNQFSMLVRAKPGISSVVEGLTVFQLVVNCGVVWADQFAVPNNLAMENEYATAVTFDVVQSTVPSERKMNNVYTAGYTTTQSGNDVWVAKYDSGGTQLWLQTLNFSTQAEHVKEIVVDSAGNVYIGGYFLTEVVNEANYDGFIAKFTANGVLVGSRTFGSLFEDGAGGMRINFDAAGNAVLTETENDRSRNRYDIVKYGFNANLTQSSRLVLISENPGEPSDIAIAPDGSIYAVGVFNDGSSPLGFIRKFSSNGVALWRDEVGNAFLQPKKVVVDLSNNAYVATDDPSVNTTTFIGLRRYDSNHVAGNSPAWNYHEASTLNNPQSITALSVGINNEVYFGGVISNNGWFTKVNATTGSQRLRREFQVVDLDSFDAIKAGINGELVIAGFTVKFKHSGFYQRDALLIKYSTNLCFF
jgi:hypothetical protein